MNQMNQTIKSTKKQIKKIDKIILKKYKNNQKFKAAKNKVACPKCEKSIDSDLLKHLTLECEQISDVKELRSIMASNNNESKAKKNHQKIMMSVR